MPSRLTSVIFPSIHLVIHIHGEFLKKPVAELEAQRGTQALSDQLALSGNRAGSPGCHKMGETTCAPWCHPVPIVSELETVVGICLPSSKVGEDRRETRATSYCPCRSEEEPGPWEPLEGRASIKDKGWEGEKRSLRRWKRGGRLELGQVEDLEKGTRSEGGGAIAGVGG